MHVGKIRRANPAFQSEWRFNDIQHLSGRIINDEATFPIKRHRQITSLSRGSGHADWGAEWKSQKTAQPFAGVIREIRVVTADSIKLEVANYFSHRWRSEDKQSQGNTQASYL